MQADRSIRVLQPRLLHEGTARSVGMSPKIHYAPGINVRRTFGNHADHIQKRREIGHCVITWAVSPEEPICYRRFHGVCHQPLPAMNARPEIRPVKWGDTVPNGMIEPILSKLAPSPGNGSVSHSAGSSRCQSWFTLDSSSRTGRCKTKVRIASTTSSIISAVVRRFNMAIRAISLP